MNKNQIRFAFYATAFGVVTVLAIRDIRTIINIEKQQRREIVSDKDLNLEAIKRAGDVMSARIDNGEIRSFKELAEAVQTEVEFQKIAIREE